MGGRVHRPSRKLESYRDGAGGWSRTKNPYKWAERGNEVQARGRYFGLVCSGLAREEATRFFESLRESAARSLLKGQVLAHWRLPAGVEIGGACRGP